MVIAETLKVMKNYETLMSPQTYKTTENILVYFNKNKTYGAVIKNMDVRASLLSNLVIPPVSSNFRHFV